ncbi:hypothetical protein [Aliarcobacter butzleri]|uniref:hypothetical protein n=1 Tax=Aliarcobacter butzleri TaxID=28197 RepID=UPI00215B5B64|nr:hypothetical protein [Aliarcobacter butzleri]MCR8709854.1 hypothetical protein [Aliarcobacter butzleri]
MKKYLLISIIFIFSGCAKYSEISPGPTIKNMDKAYIEFIRKDIFYAGGVDIPILEVVEDKLKPITILSKNQKFILETSKGKHKFFTAPLYNIIEVDIQENKTYYIDILPNNKYTFYAILLNDKSDINIALQELKYKGCNKNILNKFAFIEKGNKDNYSSPISLDITCENDKLKNYNNQQDTPNLEDINKIPSIKLSKNGKEYFNKELNKLQTSYELYKPFWDNKLKNIPLINEPYLKFKDLPIDSNLHSFNGIKIISNPKNEDEKELIDSISKSLNSYSGSNIVNIEIIINKFVDGDYFKRHFATTLNSKNHYESISVVDLDINYYDKDKKIASFNIVDSVDGSSAFFLQKIDNTKNNIIKVISDYTINNFMKGK